MNNTVISKDLANKKLHVTRQFAAPVDKVWRAWTDSEILDKWWAPKPWKAETKNMNFAPGGIWLYCMVGPNGEKAWNKVEYKTVDQQKSFTTEAHFSDDNGVIDASFPTMRWQCEFKADGNASTVDITIRFDNEADLNKIIEMGFEAGFTMGLGNLDELLEA